MILMANPKSQPQKSNTPKQVSFLFHRENYIILFVGIAILIIGYLLMSGGQQQPNEYKTEEIYSFRRITLAPIVVIVGYLVVLYSLLKKPKD